MNTLTLGRPQDLTNTCMAPGTDPADWDLPPYYGEPGLVKLDLAIGQAKLVCGGCPLMQACAVRALEQPDTWQDIVIAGVPIFVTLSPGLKLLRVTMTTALSKVALGEDLDTVHAALKEHATTAVAQWYVDHPPKGTRARYRAPVAPVGD